MGWAAAILGVVVLYLLAWGVWALGDDLGGLVGGLLRWGGALVFSVANGVVVVLIAVACWSAGGSGPRVLP